MRPAPPSRPWWSSARSGGRVRTTTSITFAAGWWSRTDWLYTRWAREPGAHDDRTDPADRAAVGCGVSERTTDGSTVWSRPARHACCHRGVEHRCGPVRRGTSRGAGDPCGRSARLRRQLRGVSWREGGGAPCRSGARRPRTPRRLPFWREPQVRANGGKLLALRYHLVRLYQSHHAGHHTRVAHARRDLRRRGVDPGAERDHLSHRGHRRRESAWSSHACP